MEEFLTVQELCKLIRMKPGTIYRWTHLDMIPHYKISRNCVRFRLKEVMAWLEERRIKGRTSLRIDR